MTLVVTEISKHGIAMAADSALTSTFPPEWRLHSRDSVSQTVRTGAQKIIPIQKINAAMAFWGDANVATPDHKEAKIPLDRFLLDFAKSADSNESLENFALRLAEELNKRIEIGRARLGVHLAGYVTDGVFSCPNFYHLHTGHSSDGPHGRLEIYYHEKLVGGSRSIVQGLEELETMTYWVWNGDYSAYAKLSTSLNELMSRLHHEENFICPYPPKFNSEIEARARFLRFQVQTICELYRLSNRTEFIAMPISWITISANGIEHFERITI